MSMRVRLGPFSVSSRGRVGVNVGPVGFYGGGRRRRSRSAGGGVAATIGALVVLGLVIEYWYVAVPIIVFLAVAGVLLLRADVKRQRDDAKRRAEVERKAARRREAEYRAWLAGPPPPLAMPGRFTQRWLECNVPYLHPGQVPVLIDELRARHWTDERINARVRPLLAGAPSRWPPA